VKQYRSHFGVMITQSVKFKKKVLLSVSALDVYNTMDSCNLAVCKTIIKLM